MIVRMRCKICGLPICPPGCPNREQEQEAVRCSVCGGSIGYGEAFCRLASSPDRDGGVVVCALCMERESLAAALLASKPLYLALCPREEVMGEWEPESVN